MASGRRPPTRPRIFRRFRRPGGLALRVALAVATFVGAFGFGYLREIPAPSAFAADPVRPSDGDPRLALWNAADYLDARLGSGGSGLTFSATQLQVLRPVPGGPDLVIGPDRDHPDATPVTVSQFVLGSVSGRGAATGVAFYAEWFNGTDENGAPTFQGDPAYLALSHGGALWRRDAMTDAAGLGWVPSSDIPGFGVDPSSLRDLPELLRRLDQVTDLGTDADGHHWQGVIDPLWYPGAVAVDGAAFTGSSISVELWLDDQDRLVATFAVARNLNEAAYQLLCIDRVRFDYATVPSIPDAPTPAATPEVTP